MQCYDMLVWDELFIVGLMLYYFVTHTYNIVLIWVMR